jgi:hypothetical protein
MGEPGPRLARASRLFAVGTLLSLSHGGPVPLLAAARAVLEQDPEKPGSREGGLPLATRARVPEQNT